MTPDSPQKGLGCQPMLWNQVMFLEQGKFPLSYEYTAAGFDLCDEMEKRDGVIVGGN